MLALLAVCALVAGPGAGLAQQPGEGQLGYLPDEPGRIAEDEMDKGLEVVLSVYSGRPNPRWVLSEGPDFDKVVTLLRSLEVRQDQLFDYGEWNRLGYASFRVHARGVEGVPQVVHVWRDMAMVTPGGDASPAQATGAKELYEALVAQAEARDFGQFFRNYRQEPGDKTPSD